MPKPRSSHRVFSREFKLGIVRRMLAGENVSVLARELKLMRKELYVWRDRFLAGGPEALRGPGRPRKAERTLLGARGARPRRKRRLRSSRRRGGAMPSWSARSASSSWNWIFFGKPCGRSRKHAGRASGLA